MPESASHIVWTTMTTYIRKAGWAPGHWAFLERGEGGGGRNPPPFLPPQKHFCASVRRNRRRRDSRRLNSNAWALYFGRSNRVQRSEKDDAGGRLGQGGAEIAATVARRHWRRCPTTPKRAMQLGNPRFVRTLLLLICLRGILVYRRYVVGVVGPDPVDDSPDSGVSAL